MNAKCDLKVLLYTYKVVHLFAVCCVCSVQARAVSQSFVSPAYPPACSCSVVAPTSFLSLMTFMNNTPCCHLIVLFFSLRSTHHFNLIRDCLVSVHLLFPYLLSDITGGNCSFLWSLKRLFILLFPTEAPALPEAVRHTLMCKIGGINLLKAPKKKHVYWNYPAIQLFFILYTCWDVNEPWYHPPCSVRSLLNTSCSNVFPADSGIQTRLLWLDDRVCDLDLLKDGSKWRVPESVLLSCEWIFLNREFLSG